MQIEHAVCQECSSKDVEYREHDKIKNAHRWYCNKCKRYVDVKVKVVPKY
jgi:predicted SprT family Zn-dependent metalloprotease